MFRNLIEYDMVNDEAKDTAIESEDIQADFK